MSDQRKRIEKAKIVKTDTEGRKVYATDGTSWACGFSYTLSWDEAYKNALTGVIRSGIKNFTAELWSNQYVLPEPGTESVLEVGFNFTES